MTTFFYSPLEQFQVLPLIPLYFGIFDFSITNEFIILVLILLISFTFIKSLISPKDLTFFIIPTRFQSIIEIIRRT